MTTNPSTAEAREVRLQRWLRAREPRWRDVHVRTFSPVTSGFSNETQLVDLARSPTGEITERVVLRVVPDGVRLFPDFDLRLQYDLQVALAGSDVRVPAMYGIETDPEVLGAPFYVMEYIEGVAPSGRRPGFHGHGLFFDADGPTRRAMYFDALDQLVKLHRWRWRNSPAVELFGPDAGGGTNLDAQVRRIEGWLDWAAQGPLDVLRAGVQWLKNHRIEREDLVVCWGDARPGNMIYLDGRVVALLDWELAHVAPPEFDLAYFVLVDRTVAEMNGVPRLAHLPDAAEAIAYYERRSGRTVRDYRYAEVFEAVRLAAMLVLTARAAPSHLSLPPDFATRNVPTKILAELLDRGP